MHFQAKFIQNCYMEEPTLKAVIAKNVLGNKTWSIEILRERFGITGSFEEKLLWSSELVFCKGEFC